MMRLAFICAVIGVLSVFGNAQAVTSLSFSFDSEHDTDNWYKDRYEPAIFESGVDGGGRTGVLKHGVAQADDQSHRANPDPFYNYQGMKHDMETPDGWFVSTSIDMYVNDSWLPGARAGFWATMKNGNLTYPIIEYVKGTASEFTGFRWWQSGYGWTDGISVPTNAWYNLRIERDSQNINFYVNDTPLGMVENLGAQGLENVILNVHNQGIAGEYDVYFDNFTMNAVPEPGTLALFGLGLLGAAGVAYRRRGRQ